MPPAADLRMVNAEGVTYVALSDVAALLLDAAEAMDQTPQISASAAMRSLSAGLAQYPPE